MRTLKLSLGMIFNPIYTIRIIQQNRGNIKASPAWILIILIPIIRIIYILTVHYPLSTVSVLNANYMVEIIIYSLPILLYVLASFCISSINDGETFFSESLISGAFCMMPYLIFTLPLSALSWLMTSTLGDVFSSLQFIVIAWCVILTFICLKVMNEYTLLKTIAMYILIIFVIILILAIALLIYSLINQLIVFLLGLFSEIAFNINYA